MDCNVTEIPYEEIGKYSRIIVDYVNGSGQLRPYFKHDLSLQGVEQAIASRKSFNTNRPLLVQALKDQYKLVSSSEKVTANIQALLEENTFTIVTAHQPNIFTGYLYFVYKILHIIKLAAQLNQEFPANQFVPVFYMGSEDADLDELGNITMGSEKIVWETDQKGAVGRMNTKGLGKIIDRIEGELSIHPYGAELISLLKACYLESADIQTATFRLVDALFNEYGLVVLIPDNAGLKKTMRQVFEDDLLNQQASSIVEETNKKLSEHYKVQANPREINLFYLKDDLRGRIVKKDKEWKVVGADIHFTEDSLKQELENYPERFSPNVILRGLYQETILPNIAFIGGGGETSYWLELKDLFDHYSVPFPMLILRNSFLFIDKKTQGRIDKLGFSINDIFKEERLLINQLVVRQSEKTLLLEPEISETSTLYTRLKLTATQIDVTLGRHVEALEVRAIKEIRELEKKMLRAEKRKFEDQQRQIRALRSKLFPNNGLQERVENFMPYFARYGKRFFELIYDYSQTLKQEFVVLSEKA